MQRSSQDIPCPLVLRLNFAIEVNRRVQRNIRAHPRLRFAPGALLREPLVGRELANRDCLLEYGALVMDSRAGRDARQADFAARLVMGFAGRVWPVRNQLVGARFVQSRDRLPTPTRCPLVS